MSRNASGTYTLPNSAVVTGTTIAALDENQTRSDIATEFTDSLSRSGKGGMTAALLSADGTVALPEYSFTSDTDTGIYRIGANNPAMSAGNTKVQDWTTTGTTVTGTLAATGVASFADGAVGTPGLNFTSDTDTGIYRVGANDIAIACNGVKQFELTAAAATIVQPLTCSGTVTVTGAFLANSTLLCSVPSGVAKAWGQSHSTGAGTTVDDAVFNCTTSISGTDILVTFGTAIGSANYAVSVTIGVNSTSGYNAVASAHTLASGSFKITASNSATGVDLDLSAVGFYVHYSVHA